MPRASKAKLSPAKQKKLTTLYKNLISKLKDQKYIASFFDEFYTPEEQIMLAKRLSLFILLKREFSTSQIRDLLGLSYETIRLHKMLFSTKTEKFHKIIETLAKTEENKAFLRSLEKKLQPLEDMLSAKTSMKSRARLLSKNPKD